VAVEVEAEPAIKTGSSVHRGHNADDL